MMKRTSAFVKLTAISVLAIFLSGCAKPPDRSQQEFEQYPLFLTPLERHVLDNGMVVILKEDHNVPLVAIQAWVQTGSTTEDEHAGSGISHFVEHMFFKGTATRPVGQIEREVKSLGGELHAFTSYDYTVYKLRLPSAEFAKGLGILADALQNATFDEVELEKERQVIMNEQRLNRDDPHRRLYRNLWANAFKVHPYKLPIIGYEPLFKNLSREDLLRYYHARYAPNNIVLVVVGAVDSGPALQSIKDLFKAFERRPLPPKVIPVEPPQLDRREIIERYDVRPAKTALAFHSVSVFEEDLYPLDLLATILGQGENSRLEQVLHREKNLVYTVDAWNYTPKDPGLFIISFSLEEGNLDRAVAATMDEVKAIKAGRLRSEELDRAKKIIINNYLLSLQTVGAQAYDLGSNEVITGDLNFTQRYLTGIRQVRRQDLIRAAKRYLREDNLTLAAVLPKEEAAAELPPAAEREKPEVEIRKEVLPNGLTLLLREDHRLPLVSVRASFLGGLRAENEENNGICNLTTRLVTKGTKESTAIEIAGVIDSLGANLETESGNNSFSFGITVFKQDLTKALELLKQLLTRATFPPEEMERERELVLSQIKTADKDIFGASSRLLRKTFFLSHPYRFRSIGSEESVQKITRDQIVNFYKDYYAANNMVLAIFGDIEAEEVRDFVAARFMDFPQNPELNIAPPQEPPSDVPRGAKNYMEKEQALVLMGFPGTTVDNEDRYSLEVLTSVLSGSAGRIYYQIREKLGLAYTLGAFSILGVDPGLYVFYAATSPEKVDELHSKLVDIVEEVKSFRVTEEELASAKAELVTSHRARIETNAGLAGVACLNELYGLGFDNYARYEDRIDKITEEDIFRVANKYLDLDRAATVITLPVAEKE